MSRALVIVGQGGIILGQCLGCHHLLSLDILILREGIFCWYRLVVVLPIFCSRDVGNVWQGGFLQVIHEDFKESHGQGIWVLAIVCKILK